MNYYLSISSGYVSFILKYPCEEFLERYQDLQLSSLVGHACLAEYLFRHRALGPLYGDLKINHLCISRVGKGRENSLPSIAKIHCKTKTSKLTQLTSPKPNSQ